MKRFLLGLFLGFLVYFLGYTFTHLTDNDFYYQKDVDNIITFEC